MDTGFELTSKEQLERAGHRQHYTDYLVRNRTEREVSVRTKNTGIDPVSQTTATTTTTTTTCTYTYNNSRGILLLTLLLLTLLVHRLLGRARGVLTHQEHGHRPGELHYYDYDDYLYFLLIQTLLLLTLLVRRLPGPLQGRAEA